MLGGLVRNSNYGGLTVVVKAQIHSEDSSRGKLGWGFGRSRRRQKNRKILKKKRRKRENRAGHGCSDTNSLNFHVPPDPSSWPAGSREFGRLTFQEFASLLFQRQKHSFPVSDDRAFNELTEQSLWKSTIWEHYIWILLFASWIKSPKLYYVKVCMIFVGNDNTAV